MSRLTLQPPAPASADDVRTVNGALANLQLKGKQGELTSMLLAAADKTPPLMPETDVLKNLYRTNGVENSHKHSLRNLALQINKRLERLPVGGLAVTCEASGKGANKFWGLRIEKPTSKSSVAVGPVDQDGYAHRTAKPQFRWSGPGISQRSNDVWVPVHGEDTEFTFRTESKAWAAPSGFAGYAKHREDCWAEYQAIHRNCSDTRVWHVAEFTQKSDRHGKLNHAIELTVAPIFFKDIVATTWRLKAKITGDKGKTTIEGWLAGSHWGLTGCRPFRVPAGNPLLVEVNVITCDGKLIVREREDREVAEKRWEPAVFGFVDSLQDVYRDALHIPAPSETVFRKSCQLLGLPVQPARVRWLGVGFGQVEGKVSLFGEVVVGLTGSEILNQNGARRKLAAIEIKPAAIHGFCCDNKVRGHFEVLLALSLKQRNPRVNIITTVPK